MLKKRIIFTLLYDNGNFMLSRNFRLKKVGALDWMQRNYDFSRIAFYIDELVVLDVSRCDRNRQRFCDTLKELAEGCFVPIAAGGGIRSVSHARDLLHSGADKIVVNTALFCDQVLLRDLSMEFGQQCVIAAIDILRGSNEEYQVLIDNGFQSLKLKPQEVFAQLPLETVGEIYLNSVDRDGTGQGYDLALLDLLPDHWPIPVILAGGVGNSSHLLAGLNSSKVDAAATAHLFNFVGDGLKNAREAIISAGMPLAYWPPLDELNLDFSIEDVVTR